MKSRFAPISVPDYSYENKILAQGAQFVAGVDEAGRGPLAGPVVVAAVVLDPANIPAGLNDSKKLSAGQREMLFEAIMAQAQVSIVVASTAVISARNIRGATLWAMAQSVRGLSVLPSHVLVDGRDMPPALPCPATALVKGDGLSVSIAAASIIAKVTRDRMCAVMALDAPQYGFGGHKGYGTATHLAALRQFGPSRHHRAGFAPVAQARLDFG